MTANIKKIVLNAATAFAIMLGTAAMATAAPHGGPGGPHGGPHGGPGPAHAQGGPHGGRGGHHGGPGYHAPRHDRYWHSGYRGYAPHGHVYRSLRHHGYNRWIGAPYWYQDRYVVRTYDRYGNVIFVELNPYTGGFIGVIRF